MGLQDRGRRLWPKSIDRRARERSRESAGFQGHPEPNRRRAEKFRTPRAGYVVLGVAFALALLATEVWPATSGARLWGPNFAAELFGIILTLAIVNEIVSAQRRRQLAPQRAAAGRRLGHVVEQFVTLLANMYKAAAPPRSPQCNSIETLLERWVGEVHYLDFTAKAPVYPDQEWATYLTETVSSVETDLKDLTDRHAEALGISIAAAVEDLIGDPCFSLILKQAAMLRGLAGQHVPPGTPLPLMPRQSPDPQSESFLGTFTTRVQALCDAYRALMRREIEVIAPWMSDSAPAWGDSRFDPFGPDAKRP
jgi:hypothetical protein